MFRWSDGRQHILSFTIRHLTSLVVSDVHSHIRQQRQHVWSLNKVPHPLSGKKTDDPSRGKRRSRSGKRGSEPHHGDGSWYCWVPLDYKQMIQQARCTLPITFQLNQYYSILIYGCYREATRQPVASTNIWHILFRKRHENPMTGQKCGEVRFR